MIQFRQDFAITYGKQMAGNVLSALPAIIVFLAAQRMIIRSNHIDRRQGVINDWLCASARTAFGIDLSKGFTSVQTAAMILDKDFPDRRRR